MAALPGVSADGEKLHKNHPKWYRPTGAPLTGLKVLNSLTETVEPFVAVGGRNVKWYTCGPTVYDMSHMGHARAYLTFDILRRIIEDYFGYSVEYQINITDIDDKIIKRARVNKLLDDFKDATRDAPAVLAAVDKAIAFSGKKLQERADKLAAPLPEGVNSRVAKEREEKIKEHELKSKQFEEAQAAIGRVRDSGDATLIANVASGLLGEWLDAEKGHEINDHSIFNAHARKFEAEYFEDMRRLGVREPDVVSRVTEVVPQVIDYVKKIEANGFAYVAESSVFFDTQAFVAAGHSYPKNKPTSDTGNATTEDEMAEGEGALSAATTNEKKSANDFALWKFSKPGEPAWDSPWGKGRPGWHIECSAMASEVLGANMDIHAGGCDLKFPHHDNELAQAEAYWGHQQWVNYFLHCGHLHIKGLKMSKSLKNFITIRQALDDLNVTPREMRLLFLSKPWADPMDFSDQTLGEVRERERVLRNFFGSVDALLRAEPNGINLGQPQGYNTHDTELNAACVETENAVHEALCNNFDTKTAVEALMALVTKANAYLLTGERVSLTLLRKVSRYITRIFTVWGVIDGTDNIGFPQQGAGNDERFNKAVDAVVAFRDDVRAAAKTGDPKASLQLCDQLRDEKLIPLGIRLEDKPNGQPTLWKNDDAAILMREISEKKAEIAAKELNKLVNSLEKQERELNKFAPFVAAPTDYFKNRDDLKGKAVQVDEAGMLVSIDGAAVDAKAANKYKQDFSSYKKSHEALAKKAGERGPAAFVAALQAEVDALKAKIADKQ